MIIRGSEGVLSYQPPWWEDNKVTDCLAWIISLSCQYCEDWGVRMIIRNWTNGVKLSQIILVRSVVSMPSNNVEWWVLDLILEELPLELVNDSPIFCFVFIPSNRGFEVSWICETIWSNWSKIRNHEMSLIKFTNVSPWTSFNQFNQELYSSLYNHYFLRIYPKSS